jgi:hypothetical protein
LQSILMTTTIPRVHMEDKLVWKNSTTGGLSLKDAYAHKSNPGNNLHWAKKIWSPDIPPSKFLLAWRIMHERMPTDEKLMDRGCQMASICSNCFSTAESTFHLYFQCSFANSIWSWLFSILNINLQINDINEIWNICDRGWTPQCKVAITASYV